MIVQNSPHAPSPALCYEGEGLPRPTQPANLTHGPLAACLALGGGGTKASIVQVVELFQRKESPLSAGVTLTHRTSAASHHHGSTGGPGRPEGSTFSPLLIPLLTSPAGEQMKRTFSPESSRFLWFCSFLWRLVVLFGVSLQGQPLQVLLYSACVSLMSCPVRITCSLAKDNRVLRPESN